MVPMKKLLPGIVTLFSLAVVGCGLAPPLRVTQHDNEVEIDVMTLGEYFTSIKTIRLTAISTSEVVWELTADSVIPRIWSFTLTEGANSAFVEGVNTEHYRIVTPIEEDIFHLERDQEYTIEVCDHTGQYCASERFSI